MKILHLCLNGPYNDGWGYQDNVLPKYHKLVGNDVVVIATNTMHLSSGEIVATNCGTYYTDEGIKVIRASEKRLWSKKLTKLFRPYSVYDTLCAEKPDFIMVHGVIGSISELCVRCYVKKVNPQCNVVVDIHQDHANSSEPTTSLKSALINWYHININKLMYPLYKKVFCITPGCADFAIHHYHIPEAKLELLPLGFDPQKVDLAMRDHIRNTIREKYDVAAQDILIVHGGKITNGRKTFELIEAVAELNNSRVKLIVFGGLANEYVALMKSALNQYGSWLRHTGHINQKDYYDIYMASDIAAFPGGQSVIWQEAIGCGLPLLIYKWSGVEYLDMGGNIKMIDHTSPEDIKIGLQEMINGDKYIQMADIARKRGGEYFSYARIAQQVLDSGVK